MRAKRISMHDHARNPLRIRFDLSRNELAFDPLPEVREILSSSAATLCHYPHNHHVAELTAEISALHGVSRDRVVIGPGSVGVLDAVLHAAPVRGSTVFGLPAFDEYAVLVSRAGGVPAGVASDPPGNQSLQGILSRADASTRQVIVGAPHSPTGATVSVTDLTALRDALPETVLLVVDQAYAEFDETLPDDAVRRLVSGPDDVVVLRSFSKAYGLAGLRIGYGVFSSAALAARARNAVPTYSVNSIGITAAAESLRHQHQLQRRVAGVIEDRNRLEEFLIRHNLHCGTRSQGNFVWVPAPDAHALFQRALSDGILVREYPGLGVRITVQSGASVDAVIHCLTEHSRIHA